MVNFIPNMDDGISYYAFLPMLATLYGRDYHSRRWLRVVDDGIGDFTTNLFADGDGSVPSDVVETVEVKTFMLAVTYGYTPYIETVFSGFQSGIDLSQFKIAIMNQAMFRNYAFRADTLLDLCKAKRTSLLSRSPSNLATEELASELYGVLVLWESLMNQGMIYPKNCLPTASHYFGEIQDGVPIDVLEEKIEELKARMLSGNHQNLQYKMSIQQRQQILGMYGLA